MSETQAVCHAPNRRRKAPREPAREVPSCIHRLDDRTRKAVERAAKLLEESAIYRTEAMTSPEAVRAYLKFKLAPLEHEEFHAIWLDAQNRIIAFERIASGTLTSASIYPREIIKTALAHNAAAVVFAHNHPSGVTRPSDADVKMTGTLKASLALVDVKLLDHLIVAGNNRPLSFAELGMI